ncbi:MAG: DUF1073 domain-containing protein, partial [Spiribacter salinus]
NLFSSFGTKRDPGTQTKPTYSTQISRYEAEAIYRADGIGKRIVDIPAEEMTRKWFRVEGNDGDKRDNELNKLRAKQAFNKALRWAGLYGGSVVLMFIDDGGDLQDEVNYNRVKGVDGLKVYDRHQVSSVLGSVQLDPDSTWFGQSEIMRVTPINGTSFEVHCSRLLVFDGEDVPDRIRQQNEGWGDSRLQAVTRALSRHAEAMGGVSSIIRDFIQPVLSMHNLSDLIASGQEEVVKSRLEILGLSRSMLNVLLIDADEESYTKQASSVAGIDKLLIEIKHDISASTGMPQTKLFGRAPEGQNSSGESQTRDFYDTVQGEQEDKVLPHATTLVWLLDKADGANPDADDRAIKFEPLWQESQLQRATTFKTLVDGVALALDYGAIDEAQADEILGTSDIMPERRDVSG